MQHFIDGMNARIVIERLGWLVTVEVDGKHDDFRVVRPDPMLCVAGYPDEMLDRKEKPVCSCFNMERTFLGIHKLACQSQPARRSSSKRLFENLRRRVAHLHKTNA